MARSAAFFDLDKTIIARSSSLAFASPFYKGGLIARRAVLRSAYAQFVYLVGGADHDQMEQMRAVHVRRCAPAGTSQQVREIVAETLHELVDPIVYDEAVELIEEHREAGRDVVIVSSSGAEVVEPIGEMLGADHVIATQMVVEDGKYTGEIALLRLRPRRRPSAMRELAEQRGLRPRRLATRTATRRPTSRCSRRSATRHAVNPDKELARVATERGWPILRFSTPVAMRRRLPRVRDFPGVSELEPRQRVALATVGVAAVAVTVTGVVWYTTRRRPAQAM